MDIEVKSGEKFIKKRTTEKNKIFACHRSGHYRPNFSKRVVKFGGSKKLKITCTAYINAKIDDYGIVEADYYIHHNHPTKKSTLPLPLQKIAINMLRSGYKDEVIIKQIKKVHPNFKFSISSLKNLKNKHNIDKYVNSKNDMFSVKQTALSRPNFILEFNPDPVEIIIYPWEKNLDISNEQVIVIDSTHDSTQYGFLLTTVAYIDKNRKFHPISWLISKVENSQTIRKFLQIIKKRVLFPENFYLITDDTKIYLNAFNEMFEDFRHILCKWHLTRNFKKKVCQVARAKYGECLWHFENLMTSHSNEALKENLKIFKTFCDRIAVTNLFEYFCNQYLNRKEKWALFQLPEEVPKTNMALEAFHKVLKYNFMQRRRNYRVDILIQHLNNYFDYQLVEKDEYNYHNKLAHRYHKTAVQSKYEIKLQDDRSFRIVVIILIV